MILAKVKLSSPIVLLIVVMLARKCSQSRIEDNLYNTLLEPYNTLERPVTNESESLNVRFGLTLLQILNVDENNQILTTNSWLNLAWVDQNLQWEPEEFGNITSVRIPPSKIWVPDILMYNSVDEGFDATFPTNVVVRSNGSIHYIPPGIFRSSCKMDLTFYPYDEQKCEMKFGSWTYDGSLLELELRSEEGGDLTHFIGHGEWEVVGIPARRNVMYYGCCAESYMDVTFTIHLKRRGEDVVKTFALLFVLISVISVLGFLLPAKSKFKLTFSFAGLFLTMFWMQTTVNNFPISIISAPFLCNYFAVLMLILLSSMVATILIVHCIENSKNACEMPGWIRNVLLKYLPLILIMHPHRSVNLENKHRSSEMEKQSVNGVVTTHSELSSIIDEIKIITGKFQEDDIKEELTKDWLYAASAINRLSFSILTIVIIISTAMILS